MEIKLERHVRCFVLWHFCLIGKNLITVMPEWASVSASFFTNLCSVGAPKLQDEATAEAGSEQPSCESVQQAA